MSEYGKDDGMMAQRLGRITQDNDNPHPVGSAAWYEWVKDFSGGYHEAHEKAKNPMTNTQSVRMSSNEGFTVWERQEDGSRRNVQEQNRLNRPVKKPEITFVSWEEKLMYSTDRFKIFKDTVSGKSVLINDKVVQKVGEKVGEKSDFFNAVADAVADMTSLIKGAADMSSLIKGEVPPTPIARFLPDAQPKRGEWLSIGSTVGTGRSSNGRTHDGKGRLISEENRPILTKNGLQKHEDVGIEYDAMKLVAISRGENGEVSFQPVYTLRGVEVLRLPSVKFINGATISFGGVKGRIDPKQ